MTTLAAIIADDDAVQRLVITGRFDGKRYWWVVDAKTRDALSGGFEHRHEAVTEARRLGEIA